MDYSVQEHLSCKTEDELGSMLRYYIVREDWKDHVGEIQMIIRELHKRLNADAEKAQAEEH